MTYGTPQLKTVETNASGLIQTKSLGNVDNGPQSSKPQVACSIEAK